MEHIAVVLIRGLINVPGDVKDTLKALHLHRQNYCTILPKNDVSMGMVKKVKDLVTWGDVDSATVSELFKKRGEEYKGRTQDSKKLITYSKAIEVEGKLYKKYLRLNPPKKGYGRKGIKQVFTNGGALGNRSSKMKDLLERMM